MTDIPQREIIWSGMLDGHWECEVERLYDDMGLPRAKGLLTISEEDVGLVYSEEVPLAYGALVGPDVHDVQIWQDTCERVIDSKAMPGGKGK